ncbi:MAG TPA: metal-dependent hydrolase [Actinomycetota bacterium]|nr:metal-dependent hydrolase [Actinomycetota bacterium]
MILWHLGTAAALVYVTLGRSRIDYRFILIGAILPDVVDGVLALVGITGVAGRGAAHSLLTTTVVAVLIVLFFRGQRRLSLVGVPVGWLIHLVCDGMWQAPRTFLWPLFGTGFSAQPPEPYSWSVITDPLAHLGTWGGELIGVALLAWFWVAFSLGEEGRFRRFLKDGHLRA